MLAVGAALCALAVAAGAFGAHALQDSLDARALGQWETAAKYLMYAGLGASIASCVEARGAGLALIFGGLVFAAAVGGLAIGGPRWLGAVAPLGGGSMIVGFGLLAWRAVNPKDG
ncbi:MAG: DUF423 domain-containing protein [Acidobacteriota bacterium]